MFTGDCVAEISAVASNALAASSASLRRSFLPSTRSLLSGYERIYFGFHPKSERSTQGRICWFLCKAYTDGTYQTPGSADYKPEKVSVLYQSERFTVVCRHYLGRH
jgi:hypothetical protein